MPGYGLREVDTGELFFAADGAIMIYEAGQTPCCAYDGIGFGVGTCGLNWLPVETHLTLTSCGVEHYSSHGQPGIYMLPLPRSGTCDEVPPFVHCPSLPYPDAEKNAYFGTVHSLGSVDGGGGFYTVPYDAVLTDLQARYAAGTLLTATYSPYLSNGFSRTWTMFDAGCNVPLLFRVSPSGVVTASGRCKLGFFKTDITNGISPTYTVQPSCSVAGEPTTTIQERDRLRVRRSKIITDLPSSEWSTIPRPQLVDSMTTLIVDVTFLGSYDSSSWSAFLASDDVWDAADGWSVRVRVLNFPAVSVYGTDTRESLGDSGSSFPAAFAQRPIAGHMYHSDGYREWSATTLDGAKALPEWGLSIRHSGYDPYDDTRIRYFCDAECKNDNVLWPAPDWDPDLYFSTYRRITVTPH